MPFPPGLNSFYWKISCYPYGNSLGVLFVVFPLLLLIFFLCVWSLLIWLKYVLGCSPWVYPVWDSLGFLDLGDYFLPHFREVFNYYLLKYFLWSFFLSSSSGTPIIWMSEHFTLSYRSLTLSSFLLILFSFFLSDSFISTILSSISLILSSTSNILLFVASRVFLISFIHYILTLFLFLLGPC